MSASFSSTLISDGTPANQIDDKMMLLLANVVNVLASAPWGTDVDAISPLFDFYESGTDEGYFSTLRMRGDATTNGVRIRDMANNEEFRLFVADVAGTPTFKIQHYSGVESETPAWTDLLEVDATKIAHDAFIINPENTSGSIKGYIDTLIQGVYDDLGGAVAGVSSLAAVSGSGILVSTPDGDVQLNLATANRNPGRSLQCDVTNQVVWADQALPAHAQGTAAFSGDLTGGDYLSWTNDGTVDRGGASFGGDNVDIPSTGTYMFTVSVSGQNTSLVSGSIALNLKLDGSNTIWAGYCQSTAGCYFSISATVLVFVSGTGSLQAEIEAVGGITSINGIAVGTVAQLSQSGG